MQITALTIELHLPGCASLKEKRGRLKPVLAGLQREFKVSAAEIDHLDAHRSSLIACVVVSNSDGHGHRLLAKIPGWIERHRPDLQVVDHAIRSI